MWLPYARPRVISISPTPMDALQGWHRLLLKGWVTGHLQCHRGFLPSLPIPLHTTGNTKCDEQLPWGSQVFYAEEGGTATDLLIGQGLQANRSAKWESERKQERQGRGCEGGEKTPPQKKTVRVHSYIHTRLLPTTLPRRGGFQALPCSKS